MGQPSETPSPCWICGRSDAKLQFRAGRSATSCPKCGTYYVGQDWLDLPKDGTDEVRVRLVGWIREQNAAGVVPWITPDTARKLFARPRPPYVERARRALRVIANKAPHLERFDNALLRDDEMLAISYSEDGNEVYTLIRLLGYLLNRGRGRIGLVV
jgi:hypothetical protein